MSGCEARVERLAESLQGIFPVAAHVLANAIQANISNKARFTVSA